MGSGPSDPNSVTSRHCILLRKEKVKKQTSCQGHHISRCYQYQDKIYDQSLVPLGIRVDDLDEAIAWLLQNELILEIDEDAFCLGG